MSDDNEESPPKKHKPLTDAERARIDRNRQKALQLRQAKLIRHPTSLIASQ